jgi:hypothetical protein
VKDGDVRIVENTWVCTSCQSTQLGRHMKCQQCGSAKEFDEQDIVPDPTTAATVTDAEQLKQATAGENWQCEYCMGQVRNLHGDCQNCAAKRDPANSKMTEIAQLTEAIKNSPMEPMKVTGEGRKLPNLSNRQAPKKKKPYLFPYLYIGGALLVVAGAIFLITRPVKATVQSIQWRYTTVVHQRQSNHGTGWGTQPESYNVACETKYKGQVQCHPHDCNPHQQSYSCNSRTYQCNPRQESYSCNCTSRSCNCRETCTSNRNGYSTCRTSCSTCSSCSTCYRTVYSTCEKHDTCYRTVYDTCYDSCPVYDQWCEYDYYTWPVRDRLKLSGNNHEPQYLDPPPQTDPPLKLERVAEFEVVFIEDGDKKTRLVYNPGTLEQFRKFDVGQHWEVKTGIGGVTPVEKP